MLKMKRIYEEPVEEDGFRILVDKSWPRGISKDRAKLDLWAKDITPSKELRDYFCHDAEKFHDFKENYLIELEQNQYSKEFVELIDEKLALGNVSFIYAAKDPEINHVVVLKEYMERKLNIL